MRSVHAQIVPGDGDPRHGTLRGYSIGCRGECCREANRVLANAAYHGKRREVVAEYYADLLRQAEREHGPLVARSEVLARTRLSELKYLVKYLERPFTRVVIGSKLYLRSEEVAVAETAWRQAQRTPRINFNGTALLLARKTARMTQADVAGKVGVHLSTVSLWERDLRTPGSATLARLEELFPAANLVRGVRRGDVPRSDN